MNMPKRKDLRRAYVVSCAHNCDGPVLLFSLLYVVHMMVFQLFYFSFARIKLLHLAVV